MNKLKLTKKVIVGLSEMKETKGGTGGTTDYFCSTGCTVNFPCPHPDTVLCTVPPTSGGCPQDTNGLCNP